MYDIKGHIVIIIVMFVIIIIIIITTTTTTISSITIHQDDPVDENLCIDVEAIIAKLGVKDC